MKEAYVKDLDLRIRNKQGNEGWMSMSELMRVFAESLAETFELIEKTVKGTKKISKETEK